MKSSKSYLFGAAIGMLLAGAADARAAVITTMVATSTNNAAGTSGPVGGPVAAPNNDNSGTPSPNAFTPAYFLRNELPLEFEFGLAASGGTTEYRVESRFINVLASPWTNFYFELGFGMGANFVRSGAGDGLDFDTPHGDPAAFSPQFSLVDHQEDTLAFRGGQVTSIGTAVFAFFLDVPDGLQAFHPNGQNRFTLRITPNGAPAATPVPEPGTMMLIGSGIAALAARLRRRQA